MRVSALEPEAAAMIVAGEIDSAFPARRKCDHRSPSRSSIVRASATAVAA